MLWALQNVNLLGSFFAKNQSIDSFSFRSFSCKFWIWRLSKRNPDQERTNQIAQIYLETTLPCNKLWNLIALSALRLSQVPRSKYQIRKWFPYIALTTSWENIIAHQDDMICTWWFSIISRFYRKQTTVLLNLHKTRSRHAFCLKINLCGLESLHILGNLKNQF